MIFSLLLLLLHAPMIHVFRGIAPPANEKRSDRTIQEKKLALFLIFPISLYFTGAIYFSRSLSHSLSHSFFAFFFLFFSLFYFPFTLFFHLRNTHWQPLSAPATIPIRSHFVKVTTWQRQKGRDNYWIGKDYSWRRREYERKKGRSCWNKRGKNTEWSQESFNLVLATRRKADETRQRDKRECVSAREKFRERNSKTRSEGEKKKEREREKEQNKNRKFFLK